MEALLRMKVIALAGALRINRELSSVPFSHSFSPTGACALQASELEGQS